jgi:hypothetical protein
LVRKSIYKNPKHSLSQKNKQRYLPKNQNKRHDPPTYTFKEIYNNNNKPFSLEKSQKK